jgi:hypothetical protein
MRRYIGYAILFCVMAAPVVLCAVTNGVLLAAAVVGITVVAFSLVYLGCWLIVTGEQA